MDKKNLQILDLLQADCSLSIEQLAEKVSLSRNACWRRVRNLEESGYILRRVALLNPELLGVSLIALVLIRTNQHDEGWLEQFRNAVNELPEIVTASRMSGDLDYMLRVRVSSVADYDNFYKRLIQRLPMYDVSASFVLEEMKDTTQLPLSNA